MLAGSHKWHPGKMEGERERERERGGGGREGGRESRRESHNMYKSNSVHLELVNGDHIREEWQDVLNLQNTIAVLEELHCPVRRWWNGERE